MYFWLLAFIILGMVTLVGYYQGGLRAAVSLIGLLVASWLAIPLAGIPGAILPAFGLKHDVLLAFIPPIISFIIVLALFKSGAFALHRKVEVYYKHKASETEQGLFGRMNTQLGICVGMVNGMIYVFLVGVILYVPGYFTKQIATSEKDHWSIRAVNTLNDQMRQTKFDKAIAPFIPATQFYYDVVDVLAYIYHTPLLQNRLATYPIFLPLADQSRFQAIATDSNFQTFWLETPPFAEFYRNNRINPLAKDPKFYQEMGELLEWDLTDIKAYLETGESAKYKDEILVGRWKFSPRSSFNLARRNKPNMTLRERQWLQNLFQTAWARSELTAYLGGNLTLKRASGDLHKGKWKNEYATKFSMTLGMGGQDLAMEGIINGRTLTLSQDKLSLIFKR